MSYLFQSDRIGFRLWKPADFEPFYAMCSDPEVMKYFLKTLNKEETEALIGRIKNQFNTKPFGLYAVDHLETNCFMGFIGYLFCDFEADFTPCIEIGWRLDQKFWNQGLATEGAKACLSYGQDQLKLAEIYSMTAIDNRPSERVMQKIGMTKIGEFDHPKVPKGHALERHHLYQIIL